MPPKRSYRRSSRVAWTTATHCCSASATDYFVVCIVGAGRAAPAWSQDPVGVTTYTIGLRYDTRCYFNVQSKADMSELSTARNQHSKVEKSKNGYAQKYRQTVRRIRVLSPREEKEENGRKDLQKR